MLSVLGASAELRACRYRRAGSSDGFVVVVARWFCVSGQFRMLKAHALLVGEASVLARVVVRLAGDRHIRVAATVRLCETV